MVMRNKPVKGPGNRSGFGTPGTQQTAQRNVRTGGMDPYNNFAKQAQRQGRSAYQRSLTPGAPTPDRIPRMPLRAPQARPEAPRRPAPRADTFGRAEVPRTGYEMLGGLPHEELLGMNQRFGLSNLTNIPGELAAPGGMRQEFGAPTDPFVLRPTQGANWSAWAGTGKGSKKDTEYGTDYAWISNDKPHVIQAYDEAPDESYIPVYIDGKLVWLSPEDYAEYEKTNDYKSNSKKNKDAYEDWEAGEGEFEKPYWEGGDPVGPEEADEPTEKEQTEAQVDGLLDEAAGIDDYPGIDPVKAAELKDGWHDQAMFDAQSALSQMYRQFAAMGISPASGAFAAATNSIMAQTIDGLLDKYAMLDLKDIDQVEIDMQEAFTNLVNIAKTIVDVDGAMDQNTFNDLKNWLGLMDESYGTLFVGLLDQMGGIWDADTAGWFQSTVNAALQKLVDGEDPTGVFEWLEDQLSNKFGEFETVD